MIHALFDPEVFIASDALWDSPEDRTEFLDRLGKHLEFIDSIGNAHILWCDKFDERLWLHPQFPPWKKTRGWNISLSQILYYNLTKHSKKLDTFHLSIGECQPPILCHCPIAHDAFLQLVSAVLINSLKPHYCPSTRNIASNDHQFRPNGTATWSQFPEVRTPQDWPKKIEPTQMFWPVSRNDSKILTKCIELVALSKDIVPSRFKPFNFTHAFLDDLVLADRREKIAESIVSRLILSTQEAARNNQLRDEEVSGGGGERRFRVTQRPSSLRIHYEIQDGKIVFKKFFDEGEHDDGL